MIKGTIFDMDGTLLETMQMWNMAVENYVRSIGIEPKEDLGAVSFTMTIDIAAKYLIDNYGLDEMGLSAEEVAEGINAPAREFYRTEAQPKPGARELMKLLYDKGIPIVVGTSSDREFVELAMRRLDLLQYVTDIISCVDIGHTKAEPVLFNMAADIMGTKPEETWVFEDGLYSILTAKENGYKTVGFYDEASKADWEAIQEASDINAIDCEHLDLERLIN